ncbi:hypothetical protein ACT7DB_35035 [Bacillus cereus]
MASGEKFNRTISKWSKPFNGPSKGQYKKVLYNIRMESRGAKEILEYKELLDQRIITEEEFEV